MWQKRVGIAKFTSTFAFAGIPKNSRTYRQYSGSTIYTKARRARPIEGDLRINADYLTHFCLKNRFKLGTPHQYISCSGGTKFGIFFGMLLKSSNCLAQRKHQESHRVTGLGEFELPLLPIQGLKRPQARSFETSLDSDGLRFL